MEVALVLRAVLKYFEATRVVALLHLNAIESNAPCLAISLLLLARLHRQVLPSRQMCVFIAWVSESLFVLPPKLQTHMEKEAHMRTNTRRKNARPTAYLRYAAP